MKRRIGLLLPGSNYIPGLATDIRRWFSEGLGGNTSEDVEFVVEATGYNASRTEVRSRLQDLFIKHDVDLVVAPLNPGMVPQVADLARNQQAPLFVLTLGEDIFEGDLAPPWVFVTSLGAWRSAWLAGYWAVGSHGPNLCCITSSHDGGYGLAFAFGLGLEAAGGNLAATIPSPVRDLDDDTAAELVGFASGMKPDAVMLLASGDDRDALARAMADHPETLPTVGLAPFAYLPGARAQAVPLPEHTAFGGWNPMLPQSAAFIEAFHARAGRPAHAYALLAYETGGLIGDALRRSEAPPRNEAFLAPFMDATFDGPRGPIAFDGELQEATADQVRMQVSAEPDGVVVSDAETIPAIPLLTEQIAAARKNLDKQGWFNPYLIA